MVNPDHGGTEVVLVPAGRGQVVAFPWEKLQRAAREQAIPVAQALIQLLSSPSTAPSRHVFALRPEDEAALRTLRTVSTGEDYFRGFLFDERGKIAHHVALRDVTRDLDAAPVTTPGELVMAAQMAAILERLEQIQDGLDEIRFDVGKTLEYLQRDAASDIVAAVTTVHAVHANYATGGRLHQTDWSRIAGLEQVITHRHVAVVAEMERMATSLRFNGKLDHDRKLSHQYPASRFAELVHQEVFLAQAGWEWATLYGAALINEGVADVAALESSDMRHQELSDRARAAVDRIQKTLEMAPEPKMSSLIELIIGPKGRGGILGYRSDRRKADEIRTYKHELRRTAGESRAVQTQAIPILHLDTATIEG